MVNAFQQNAFQPNAFQEPVFSVDAFQRCAFQFGAFQTSVCPDENTKSGVNRMWVMQLQEEADRLDAEKRKESIDKAVAEVMNRETKKQYVPKKPAKAVEPKPRKPKAPPVPLRRIYREPEPEPLHQFVVFQQSLIMQSLVTFFPFLEQAAKEAANDEEDIELLLLAA